MHPIDGSLFQIFFDVHGWVHLGLIQGYRQVQPSSEMHRRQLFPQAIFRDLKQPCQIHEETSLTSPHHQNETTHFKYGPWGKNSTDQTDRIEGNPIPLNKFVQLRSMHQYDDNLSMIPSRR